MSPYRSDPKVDYRRIGELSEEFTQFWNRIQALYLDAVAGFAFVRSRVEAEQAFTRSIVPGTDFDSEDFQDALSFSYTQIFAADFATSAIHEATQGEVKARNSPGGANFRTLGQLCLVSFYDFWNDYLRREYVIAKGGLDRNEKDRTIVERSLKVHASHDLWGDVRLLRQSVVHNHGIAVSEVSRCKLICWFKPGEPVALSPERMRAIFLALLKYRNDLFAEQFPQHYIQLPAGL
ncbi:MAG TPA: hypothetical protein VLV50_10775 [Stellaceae bacterium]|nr:hypothetical protein [Stellaceae bacterium]